MFARSLAFAAAFALLAQPAFAQGRPAAVPQVREVGTLIYDGLDPQTPPEIRERLRRYQNARSAGFADWLPDGSMLITTRFGETSQLHHVSAPGADRRQITFFDEPVNGASVIPGTDRFVYGRDVGGAEYFGGYLAGLTGPETAFTEPNTRNTSFVFSPDGRTVAWSRVTPGQADYDIMVMRVGEPASRRVAFEGTGAVSPIDISPDGRSILFGRFFSSLKSERWLLDVASGRATQLNPTSEDVAYGGGEFAPDGRSIILTSDQGVDQPRLVQLDLRTGRTIPLTEDGRWGVESFDLSDDGRLLAWATNEDGWSRVHLRDFRTRRALAQPELPQAVIGGVQFSPDGRRLALSVSSPTSAGDVYSWDLRENRLTRWTQSELGGLDPSSLVAPTLVRFNSFDRESVPAFVYRPRRPNGARAPVIIDIHGGPEAQTRPGFNPRIQYWTNELGVAVITPNVRGSDGYGKRFLALDNGPLRQNSVRDIGALLDWVRTQPDLDPERVVVYGGSYGGFMVLASLIAYPERLAGGVDIVGIADFETFLANTEGYRRDLRRAEYGDERDPAMRAIFRQISPLRNVARIADPLLVIQGYNDPRVPRTEAEQIVRAVRARGLEAPFLMARDEGHGFRKKRNIDAQREAETVFLQRVLRLSGG